MSTSFSANQYDDAFIPKKLSNWQSPKLFDERPRALEGSTMTMVDDSGHMRPEFQRSKSGNRAWGTFIGTWDLPRKLPGTRIDVPTGRSQQANDNLRNEWEETRMQLTGQPWGTINNTIYKQGTKPLAYTASNGCENNQQSTSYAAQRNLSPIERTTSAGYRMPDMLPDTPVEHHASVPTQLNKIPLPRLDRPVYMHSEEMPYFEESVMYAM